MEEVLDDARFSAIFYTIRGGSEAIRPRAKTINPDLTFSIDGVDVKRCRNSSRVLE
jgi:hypothetical protein